MIWSLVALCSACAVATPLESDGELRGARKFAFFPAPVSSHFAIAQPIMEDLLERGHLVKVRTYSHSQPRASVKHLLPSLH